jgi:hypothetical protein
MIMKEKIENFEMENYYKAIILRSMIVNVVL